MAAPLVRTPEDRTVALPDGRSIHALQWRGRGLPIVLLHGLLDSAEGWVETAQATRRPVLAIDLGGFGESDLPTHPAFSAYAADVVVAIEALVNGPFVLVGHSLGGGVATAVAEQMGSRVRALVLLAPAGFGRITMAEAISIPGVRDVASRVLPFALGNRAVVSTSYKFWVANGVAATPETVARLTGRGGSLVEAAVTGTKTVVRGGLSPRAFHRRGVDYDGPVVALWGDHDRLVPLSHLSGVSAAFPHAETHVWRGMGHHPQRERPEEFLAFLEETCRMVDEGVAPRRDAAAGGRRRTAPEGTRRLAPVRRVA